jgi:hypothetical protein
MQGSAVPPCNLPSVARTEELLPELNQRGMALRLTFSAGIERAEDSRMHDSSQSESQRVGGTAVNRQHDFVDAPFPFNVVIAYEDFDAAKRAEKMIGRLQNQLCPTIQIISESWKFELIGNSRLRPLAAEAAGHANMLILALTNEEDLPDYMKQWLAAWASLKRSEPVALVALHNGESHNAEVPPLLVYLQGLTKQGDLDLFWHGEGSFAGISSYGSVAYPPPELLRPMTNSYRDNHGCHAMSLSTLAE